MKGDGGGGPADGVVVVKVMEVVVGGLWDVIHGGGGDWCGVGEWWW